MLTDFGFTRNPLAAPFAVISYHSYERNFARYGTDMELAVPCPNCKSNSLCECSQALTAFFKILETVQTRVLRQEASSRVEHLPVKGAGVDKLNAELRGTLSPPELVNRAKQIGYQVEEAYLNEGRRKFLKISKEGNLVHFRLTFDRQSVDQLISNPNRFGSWGAYLRFIQSILTPLEIQSSQVIRADLNLDFASPLLKTLQAIDIKNKRASLTFKDQSGVRTGVIIGKGNESIEIYDKAKKEVNDLFHTRLELRLAGRKLPTRNISDIPEAVLKSSLFKNLEGVNVVFKPCTYSDTKASRLEEFKSIFKREGFLSAKKEFSKDRNFDRNFKDLIEIRQWTKQPAEIFHDQVKRFFEGKGHLTLCNIK